MVLEFLNITGEAPLLEFDETWLVRIEKSLRAGIVRGAMKLKEPFTANFELACAPKNGLAESPAPDVSKMMRPPLFLSLRDCQCREKYTGQDCCRDSAVRSRE